MYPSVSDCVNQFIDHLKSYAKDGKDIDLKEVMGNFTIDVIAMCDFATQTNAHKDSNNPFFTNGKNVFNFSYKFIMGLVRCLDTHCLDTHCLDTQCLDTQCLDRYVVSTLNVSTGTMSRHSLSRHSLSRHSMSRH